MDYTGDLKRVWNSAPANIRVFQALYLTNPAWAAAIAIVDNTIEPLNLNWGGVTIAFQPSVFDLDLSTLDANSLPELSLSFPNFGQDLYNMLEQAAASGSPINVQITNYTDYDNNPGYWPPLTFDLTEVALDENNVTGTARRADFINRAFPREVFNVDNYPGLYR